MKENYQKQLDALLSALPPEEKPRLLLQSCCGPCSSYVLEYLTRYFRVTVLYYNPNIQPRSEYDRRLYWQQELIRRLPTPEPVALLACDYDGQRYIDAVRGLEREPEGGARCTVCFRLRLEETARQARAHGFDYFGTTLTVSPHKDAQRLNTIGASLRSNTACAGCRRTSKSARATSAALSCPANMGSTGRNIAAACTVNRLTTAGRRSRITAVTISTGAGAIPLRAQCVQRKKWEELNYAHHHEKTGRCGGHGRGLCRIDDAFGADQLRSDPVPGLGGAVHFAVFHPLHGMGAVRRLRNREFAERGGHF